MIRDTTSKKVPTDMGKKRVKFTTKLKRFQYNLISIVVSFLQ